MKSTRRNFLKLIPSVVAISILPAQQVVKSSPTEEALNILVELHNNNIVVGPLSLYFASMHLRWWNGKVRIFIEGSLPRVYLVDGSLGWLQEQQLLGHPLLIEFNKKKHYQMLLTQYDISNDLRMVSAEIMLIGIQI